MNDKSNGENHLKKSLLGVWRRASALVITAATAAMTVASGGVTTAFAAETTKPDDTQTFAVVLADSEHGSLSFDGKDGTSLDVKSGDDVTVAAKPDDGYVASLVSVVGASGDPKSIDVDSDGKVTFKPTEDVVVTGYFVEDGGSKSSAVSVDSDKESANDGDVESYIRSHMDSKYVGSGKSLSAVDVVTTNSLVVDGGKFSGKTVDDLWADNDGDGVSDQWTALVNSAYGVHVLYKTSDDAKYYVGKVGDMSNGKNVTDVVAGRNDTSGTVYDDVVYDKESGLVYVPVARTKDGKNAVRVELLYVTGDSATSDVAVSVDKGGVKGDVADSGTAEASTSALVTNVTLANDDEARKSISSDTIDSVVVNGVSYGHDTSMWSYNEATGVLSIAMSPVDVDSVSVKMSNGFMKSVRNLFSFTAKADTAPSYGGTWTFSNAPQAGMTFKIGSRNYYLGDAGATYNVHAANNGSPDDLARAVIDGAGISTKELWTDDTTWGYIERVSHIKAQTVTVDGNTIQIPAQTVGLYCAHISHGENHSYPDDLDIDVRVLDVDMANHTMTIAIVSPTMNTQAGVGLFTVTWKQAGGYLSAVKVPEDSSYTNGNSAYDMTGSQYGVYKDAECTNRVDILTVQNNTGVTNEVGPLEEGTYYLKEIKSGNCGYTTNPAVASVEVTSGGHSKVTLDGQFAEPATKDPMAIMVQKALDGEDKAGTMRGDVKLSGVQFRVDYYSDVYDSVAAAQASGSPKASAVFATDDDGFLLFGAATPVSGTWPYHDGTGMKNTIPLGTVVITEVNAPSGVAVSGDPQAFTLTDADSDGKAEPHQIATWPSAKTTADAVGSYIDKVWRGGVLVTKAEKDWNASRDQGDGSLADVKYEIINRSDNKVKYDGKDVAVGDVVTTITTKYDDNLKAYVAKTDNVKWDGSKYVVDTDNDKTLEYGTYEIREVNSATDGSANDSHLNAGWSDTFQITEDGQLKSYDSDANKWNANDIWRGGLRVGKVDRETKQYIQLGEAHLDGAVFDVINRSANDVKVNGVTYKPGESVLTMATEWHDGKCYADSGKVLPYGTYEVREIKSGTGYLYDDTSKSWTVTLTQHTHDGYVDLLDEDDVVANQVSREDWSFKKKDEDSMERMDKVAFEVTSNTTGETHVIVTDENGTWGSSWNVHTQNTNANDPDSPNTNGAIQKDADGDYKVVDSSKLDSEAGTWFTGMSSDMTKWAEDGESYDVNGRNVKVNDGLRAFPYDTYTVTELASDTNKGHRLVQFTVTLHKYGNPNGEGIDFDYGTIDDKTITIGTELSADTGKSVPSVGTVNLTDTVSYNGLSQDEKYTLKGELHAVDDDGNDKGVVATAESEFTASNMTGKTDVVFENVDMSKVGTSKLVAFESLEQNGDEIVDHKDLTDENQTVTIPRIGTTFTGDVEHEANAAAKTIKLTDTVDYSGVEQGKNYTLTATLMDKETGEAVKDADGNPITATTAFAPSKSSGKADVVFEFSGVDVAGKTVVAFESLTSDNVEFATHNDINDEGQTVTFPKVGTTATDKASGGKIVAADKNQTVVDTVDATNLVVGKEYKVSGALHLRDKDGKDLGALKDADGKDVVASTTFKADKADMKVNLEFTFDASALGGQTIVAFEDLSREDKTLAVHADITDEGQSVYVPKIGTTMVAENGTHVTQASYDASKDKKDDASADAKASDESVKADSIATEDVKSDSKVAEEVKSDSTTETESDSAKDAASDSKSEKTEKKDETVVLTDTIAYENLEVGKKYTVSGELHLQDVDKDGNIVDGGALKDADGKAVTATAEFTPEKTTGTVDVTFTFNAAGLAGHSVVAFETVKEGDRTVATHSDITDKDQTVSFVDVQTTALDKTTKTHAMSETTHVELVDTVAYEGLTPGKEYTLTGMLHVQKTAASDGKKDDAKATDSNAKADDKSEAKSDDKSDAKATDSDAKAEAASTDKATESDAKKDESADVTKADDADAKKDDTTEDATILKGKDGKPVTATVTFTPKEANGTVDVPFDFEIEAGALDGQTVVAFEDLSEDGVKIATHADINDESQSVHKMKVGTTLTGADKKSKDIQKADKVSVVDSVHYENLYVGEKYTVKGTLVDGEGKAIKDSNGNPVTAETEFTPEATTGDVEMTFTLDTSSMANGAKVVAYEYVYSANGTLVGKHEDVNDEGQTVTVKEESKTPPTTTHVNLQTGIGNAGIMVAIAMLAALAGAVTYYVRKRQQARG